MTVFHTKSIKNKKVGNVKRGMKQNKTKQADTAGRKDSKRKKK